MNPVTSETVYSITAAGLSNGFESRAAQGNSGVELKAAITGQLNTVSAGSFMLGSELSGAGASGRFLYVSTWTDANPPHAAFTIADVQVTAIVEPNAAALSIAVARELARLTQLVSDDPTVNVLQWQIDTAMGSAGGTCAAVIHYWPIPAP